MFDTFKALTKGLVFGAGAMYFCDPQKGRRRRAAVKGRAVAAVHEIEDLWTSGVRDLEHRTAGFVAQAKRLVTPAGPADDELVRRRVRSALGHLVRNARKVQVSVAEGGVLLRGEVRPGETERLIPAVERVPGVRHVESGLRVAGEPVADRDCPVHGLPPAGRLLMTAGGGLMMLYCLGRRGFGAGLVGTAGFGLLARGLTDRPGRPTGLSAQRRGIDVRKTVFIDAPVEKVFDFIADVEQSKRFLPNVTQVEELGGGRTRWTLAGPVGEIEFIERTTHSVPNERLDWESETGSPVAYVAETRFEPEGQGTRVSVRMTYRPPAGVFGHAAAELFGVDPKSLLTENLNRIKLYLEEGTVPHDVQDATVKQHG